MSSMETRYKVMVDTSAPTFHTDGVKVTPKDYEIALKVFEDAVDAFRLAKSVPQAAHAQSDADTARKTLNGISGIIPDRGLERKVKAERKVRQSEASKTSAKADAKARRKAERLDIRVANANLATRLAAKTAGSDWTRKTITRMEATQFVIEDIHDTYREAMGDGRIWFQSALRTGFGYVAVFYTLRQDGDGAITRSHFLFEGNNRGSVSLVLGNVTKEQVNSHLTAILASAGYGDFSPSDDGDVIGSGIAQTLAAKLRE